MKAAFTLGIGLAAMALVAALSRLSGLESARVELAAVLVAYACTSLSNRDGALCAFGSGYLEDVLSGHPTGLFAFAAMVGFLVGRVVVVAVDIRGPAGAAILAALVSLGYQVAALGTLTVFPGRGGPPSSFAMAGLLPSAVLTALAALVLYPILRRLDVAFDREESSMYLR